MIRVFTIALLVLICVAYSCKPGSDGSSQSPDQVRLTESDFYAFKVRDNLNQFGELLLSTIAKEIQYIPLETTPACLLSRCRQVELFNNHIYVQDSKALYQFDMDGSFVQQIGKIGNGPGEYGSVSWFNSINKTNEIVLYCYPSGRINVYDAESGEFKRSFRFDFDLNGFLEFPPGELTFFTWNTKRSENQTRGSEIYICNLEGDIIDSIPDERMPRSGNIVGKNLHFIVNESLHYMDTHQDTLYSLSEDIEKESYASFGLRNKVQAYELKIKNQIGEVQFPDFLVIDEVIEDNVSFFITIEKGIGLYIPVESYKIFYDKRTGHLVNCTSVINDLNDGMPFWPKSVYKDSVLIDFCPAIEFLDYFQTHPDNPDRPEELKDLINTLDENDNPIIILASQQ